MDVVASVERSKLSFSHFFFQDTVIGLQALSEFAELIYTSDTDFTVQLTSSADPSFSQTIKVNQQNSMVLQLVEVTSHVTNQ